ncbi:NucA/NucB deoxyribonuclease domain-containing protein [Nonomuraea roseoviolacea]|uniref:Deoxyribonuclease NucA/NucB domain-containing protein n=1 Tax=Nonomuraea roseoviolacea subsp. carminata TaxID=160689 RepID=A0ABT1KDL2_9ACTN|nr:NucA/NucB deoxyribonuclease domain-containing protein [Nonomuraea roseoviolacea]MCP2352111.1 hypothetical protein [Nonomuraea roseoviolacea subsp. carminata]
MSRPSSLTRAVLGLALVTATCLGASSATAATATTAPAASATAASRIASSPSPSDAEAHERALRMARELGDHSYFDADKAPRSRPEHGLLAAAADFPATPPQPDTNDCLVQREARRLQGWTYNRLLWCQEIEHETRYEKTDQAGNRFYVGSVWIRWEMVALGSNTQRTIRVFWRPVPATVRYVDWTAPEDPSRLFFGVHAECVQGRQNPAFCWTDQSQDKTTWQAWNTTTQWTSWDIQAPAQAGDSSREKITRPDWYLVTDSRSLTFPEQDRVGHTLPLPLRCDSADYFSIFGRPYDKACVFTAVIPHIQYNLSSTKHGAVARHIRDAQLDPDGTYPIENHRKVFPGWWEPGDSPPNPLHRVEKEGTIGNANETWKDYACKSGGPYTAATRLPPRTPQQVAEGWQCDEYPFRATAEGASSGTWDFSVRWVPPGDNTSAGGSLSGFFWRDRILFVNDPFWVKINP